MKQGKRPTRKQKEAMLLVRLNPENWLVTKNVSDKLHLVHRETDRERIIPA
ncbi:hypothetical protein PP175_21495 [Aneurinibacillus sp. Ricciae_BoGa-3]|uniref:DUF6906 family protein n=1 Tax=Aneurinibacillus sp. Ricciae_BoGa-3 TaxID=3022697 RepID=UPI0023416457|nr:hypothetical protein [Aneurinibacillus sp. Ricciae_BoGa-3]WCK53867.1 hypothetical protein PP175_21495 [Aneurinibacillus sp. Ricciae_BoGa-3]